MSQGGDVPTALEPERLAELRAVAFEGDGCTSNAMHEMLDEIERLRKDRQVANSRERGALTMRGVTSEASSDD